MPSWLKDAIFYEIYPQSFMDSNGDGIGDIQGIISKLPYIASLGCNAIWLNPVYDSPFKDAGYDVRDYLKVAERYGSNEDLYELFEKAHDMGIRVLLDLVPGHTSEEHPWFIESSRAERNDLSDRYIWTDSVWHGIGGHPYISGECERDGVYMLNFFKCQPALNYGFAKPELPWQQGPEDDGPMATRQALKDIMRFWLSKGCDGFRVDMADSLVKEDDNVKSATARIWTDIRAMLDRDYPEAALVSEWGDPTLALKAGFHMDFYLDHVGNGYNTLVRDYESQGRDQSYFLKDSGGNIRRFLDDYLYRYNNSRDYGYISFISGNHDTPRLRKNLDTAAVKLVMAFILTMPGVPFIYYGDEIGMRYLDLPTHEGGYGRTGSRSPMQWSEAANLGFSAAAPDKLYLPVDPATDAPSVEQEEKQTDSLLNCVRRLTTLRHSITDLQADGDFAVVCDGQPFVYRRGKVVCAINPSGSNVSISRSLGISGRVLASIGDASVKVAGECVRIDLGAQAFVVIE